LIEKKYTDAQITWNGKPWVADIDDRNIEISLYFFLGETMAVTPNLGDAVVWRGKTYVVEGVRKFGEVIGRRIV
jgi:hypothetical protein